MNSKLKTSKSKTGLAVLFAASFALGAAMTPVMAQDKGEITLYNGQHKNATAALIDAFESKSGIKVIRRDGNSNELAHQIIEEGQRSPADVIYTEESTPQFLLKDAGLLTKINSDSLENIPSEYVDEDGYWTGVLARSRVVAYNPSLISVEELPTSVFDLIDEEWKDKVAFVPTSGAFRAQLSAMIKLEGEEKAKEWLEGLKRNGKIYRKNTVALEAVERGEIPFGLINNYYWDRQVQEVGLENMNSRLYFFGTHDLGDMLTIASMGILESSSNKESAQAFVAFALSEEGQQILTSESAQYPLNAKVKLPPELKPFSELTPPEGTLNLGEYSDGEAAVKLLMEVGLL